MKIMYWLCAAAVVGLGLFVATSFTVEAPTTTKLSVSQYKSPEELAQKLIKTFQTELSAHSVVLLGVTPNQVEDLELWESFLEQLKGTDKEFQVLVLEKKLPYIENFKDGVRVDVTAEKNRFVQGLEAALAENLRVAVVLPYHYSSQLVTSSPAQYLKNELKLNVLSLTALKFPVTRQQESSYEPKCHIESRPDPIGTGQLGCTVIQFSQKTYQQKFNDNEYSSFLEQISPTDFLILFNQNAGSR